MQAEIVRLADRPGLLPLVAGWLWSAFWRQDGQSLEDVVAETGRLTARHGMGQCFVALLDGIPCATASFTEHDLDERPDLAPWLAGVFVEPAFRGRALATQLVRVVEAAAAAAGIETLWLYTTRAEGLYLKLGWQRVQVIPRAGKLDAVLMRRPLPR